MKNENNKLTEPVNPLDNEQHTVNMGGNNESLPIHSFPQTAPHSNSNNFFTLPSFIRDQSFSTKMKGVAFGWLCTAACFSVCPYANNPIVLLGAVALTVGVSNWILNSSPQSDHSR